MARKRKESDASIINAFVEAHRKENPNDPRVLAHDEAKRRKRSEASKLGHANRRAREANRQRASSSAGRTPIEARVIGSAPPAPSDVMRDLVPTATPRRGPFPPASAPAARTTAPRSSTSSGGGKGPARRGGTRGISRGQRQGLAQAAGLIEQRQTNRELTGGKPSVTGHAVGGAAAGAATGAAVGSIVPGVGTAVGGAVGAGIGGAGGAVSGARKKRAFKRAQRELKGTAGFSKALVAEFAICIVIVALSPLTDKHKTDPPAAWMKRMTAVMGVFLVLALVSAFGRGPARVAAAFGGLATVTLAVSERDLFVRLAGIMGTGPEAHATEKVPPVGGSTAGAAGGLIGG